MTAIQRAVALSLAALTLAGCDPTRDLDEPPVKLGNFRLGHNIVVSDQPETLPGSRIASDEEWIIALTGAIDARFGRYEGSKFYHFGISVDAYNLAAIDIPGVPTPKSGVGLTATVWDDAAGKKLNEKGEPILVLGILSGAGIQPDKQTQLDNLSALAAKEIERWLLKNPEWFGLPAEDASGS